MSFVAPFTEQEIHEEFRKIIQKNPDNCDQDYLDQLELEIIELGPTEDNLEGFISTRYKIHNFEYYHEFESSSNSTINTAERFVESIYIDIVCYSDLLKKDPKIRKIIEDVNEEVNENLKKLNKKQRRRFWGFDRNKVARKHYMGDCHIYWEEKKRILKEKYNIDWKSPQDRMPHAKFD